MRFPIAALAAALLFVLSSSPARAQGQPGVCGDAGALIAHLEKDWGENVTAIALDAAGRLVRVLHNPETGTWTMLVTAPGGRTCMISHGSDWEEAFRSDSTGAPS